MSLLSRDLWHALHNALPRHPMLWYRLRVEPVQPTARFRLAWGEAAPTVSVILGALLVFFLWALVGLNPIALVFLLDTTMGITIARSVSAAIVRARVQGVYDLMGVTPSGMLGATWALTTRTLRRDPTLDGLHQTAHWIHLTWLLLLTPYAGAVVLTLCSQLGTFTGREFDGLLNPLTAFNGFAILAIMSVDYQGSFASGALVGMLAPSLTDLPAEASLMTPVGLLGFQLLTYSLAVVLQTLMLGLLAAVGGSVNSWTASICFVLSFVVAREGLLLALCVGVARRLNTSLRDLLNIYRRGI